MNKSYFAHRQLKLAIYSGTYVVFLLIAHLRGPVEWTWYIAAALSVIMNATYLIEAFALKRARRAETLVASTLIGLSILGAIVSPVFVISAIFGHGAWDLAKLRGVGVPFFEWYTSSCFFVDSVYATALVAYFIVHGS